MKPITGLDAGRIKRSLAVVHHEEKNGMTTRDAVLYQRKNLSPEDFEVLCNALHCPELAKGAAK